MTNKKTHKKSVVASLVAIVICFAMLLGTTYAWFTDSVINTNNIIKSGNIDVELMHDSNDKGNYEVVDGTTKLFVNKNGDEILWEPGASTKETFEVKNVGTLALKYEFSIKALSKTLNAENNSLLDVLKLTVNGEPKTFGDTFDATIVAGGAPVTYTVTINWPSTENDNDYMNLKVLLGIELVATQFTSEFDGTGDQYDSEAQLPEISFVSNAEELVDGLVNGGNLILTSDVNPSTSLKMNGGVLDGNGNTITATTTIGTGNATINPTGGTIKNIVIKGTGNTRSPYGIGSIQFSNTALVEDMYVENVDVSGTRMAIDIDAAGNNVYVKDCELANMIQIANQEEVVFENCHFYCDGTTPAALASGTNNIMLLGNMTFINCHFEENINIYVDDRCSGTIEFINCTYGNNGVEDRPFESTVGFFTWWLEPQGIVGYQGSFGDGDAGRTNFTCIVNDTIVWEASNN